MATRLKTAIKTGLCALVLAAAGLAIGLGGPPAHAVTTSIIIALAVPDSQHPGQTVCLSPPTSLPTVVAMVGGAPVTVCVWAKDVTNPRGVGSFNIEFSYNGNLVTVQTIVPDTTWLHSTGRTTFCNPVYIDPNLPNGPYSAHIACNTYLPPPPNGPQGTGLLGKVVIQPRTQPGLTTLTFPAYTYIMDTGYVQGGTFVQPAIIVATVNALNVRVAACADYNNDHTVRMPDIFHIVQKYGTHDVPTDLDLSGTVLTSDIGIGVLQYGRDCPT